MPYIPGSIPVTGFIGPTDSTDTYAVTDAIYGIDGYRSLSSTTVRDAISTERRREGMLVYTQNDQNVWQLLPAPWSGVSADWKLFISSGITAFLTATTLSGIFLPLSGGTVTGDTIFTTNLSAYTFSATNILVTNLSGMSPINVGDDFIMNSLKTIRSSNGGGQLDLDYFGSPGEVMLSTDNGAWSNESQLYLKNNTIELSNYDTGGTISLYGGFDSTTIGQIRLGSLVDGVLIRRMAGSQRIELIDEEVNLFSDGGYIRLDVSNGELLLKYNSITDENSGTGLKQAAIFIGAENSFINSGVTNSIIAAGSGHTIVSGLTNVAIIGGQNISATTSNTVFMPKITLASTSGAQVIIPAVNASAPADGSMWFTTSGGTTYLNYRVTGSTKSVELT